MKRREPAKSRKPYAPPRVRSERTFEQSTLACGKLSGDHISQSCSKDKIS